MINQIIRGGGEKFRPRLAIDPPLADTRVRDHRSTHTWGGPRDGQHEIVHTLGTRFDCG